MAYCLKCGAYIPDGQLACLACGYDPEAEKKKAEEAAASKSRRSSAAAAARQTDSNAEMRARLEEQRRRSQEKNRQWAEQEARRREEAAAREAARREQQEKDREWARQEYEKRQAEKQKAQTETRSSGMGQTFGEYYREHTGSKSSTGNKALAAISYLSILFAIPYFLTPNDEYARFHAKQGMKLFLFGILADILGSLIGLGWLVTLVRLYLIYKGMSNALNGKMEELPWIGNLGEK